MKTPKIVVEPYKVLEHDWAVCDVARVSMAKKADQFSDEKNLGLIKYLLKDMERPHFTPFAHIRIAVKFWAGVRVETMLNLWENGILAGFSWAQEDNCYFLNGSLWAWFENWQYMAYHVRRAVYFHVKETYPDLFKLMFKAKDDKLYGECVGQDYSDINTFEDHYPVKTEVVKETGIDRTDYLSFRVTCPIFIARQLVKHQVHLVWNEESRRYIDELPVFFDMEHFHARPEGSIKQGSGGLLHEALNEEAMKQFKFAERVAAETYEKLLAMDVAPEEARAILPLHTQVQWIWTGSVEAWKRVHKLRWHGHAQTQAQEFARQLGLCLAEAGRM